MKTERRRVRTNEKQMTTVLMPAPIVIETARELGVSIAAYSRVLGSITTIACPHIAICCVARLDTDS